MDGRKASRQGRAWGGPEGAAGGESRAQAALGLGVEWAWRKGLEGLSGRLCPGCGGSWMPGLESRSPSCRQRPRRCKSHGAGMLAAGRIPETPGLGGEASGRLGVWEGGTGGIQSPQGLGAQKGGPAAGQGQPVPAGPGMGREDGRGAVPAPPGRGLDSVPSPPGGQPGPGMGPQHPSWLCPHQPGTLQVTQGLDLPDLTWNAEEGPAGRVTVGHMGQAGRAGGVPLAPGRWDPTRTQRLSAAVSPSVSPSLHGLDRVPAEAGTASGHLSPEPSPGLNSTTHRATWAVFTKSTGRPSCGPTSPYLPGWGWVRLGPGIHQGEW